MFQNYFARCKYCHESYKPSSEGAAHGIECRIRPEVRALIDRGNITQEEWKNFRGNSWEWEALVPALSNQALLKHVYQNLENCSHNRINTSRPCLTYDEALAVVLVPELLKRLQEYEDLLVHSVPL